MSRQPPTPERPTARRRTSLLDGQLAAIAGAAREAGVPAAPWLAWAKAAAEVWGPAEATRRALMGARSEPAWSVGEAVSGAPRRRSWWRGG